MKGLLTLEILCFCLSCFHCFEWYNPIPNYFHSDGLPCPDDANKKCRLGYRCDEISCIWSFDKVAFETLMTGNNNNYPDFTTLVFPSVLLNDGQGYNRTSGIFKAPSSGVYKFSVNICEGSKEHMVIAVFKGQTQLSNSTWHDGTTSSCVFHSVLSKVVANEEVKVVARWTNSIPMGEESHRSSFNGVLMYKY